MEPAHRIVNRCDCETCQLPIVRLICSPWAQIRTELRAVVGLLFVAGIGFSLGMTLQKSLDVPKPETLTVPTIGAYENPTPEFTQPINLIVMPVSPNNWQYKNIYYACALVNLRAIPAMENVGVVDAVELHCDAGKKPE